jgi:thiol reductant ABC exporter CydC subunit
VKVGLVRGEIRRLVRLVSPEKHRLCLAVVLQVATVGAGVGLMGTSAWLISKAALHPSIAALQVAVVGVRFFGLSRGLLRYLERLVSHDLTLRVLTGLRVAVYRALEPLAPARLVGFHSGDLLGRVLEDVGALESLYVRVLGPSLSALAFGIGIGLALLPFGGAVVSVTVGGLIVAGLVLPAVAARLGRASGRLLVEARGELAAHLTDGIHGMGEILAFGREEDHTRKIEARSRSMLAAQGRLVRAAAAGGALSALSADLTVVLVLALCIPAVRSGSLDGVWLAVVALLTLSAFEAVAGLPAAWQSVGSIREAGARLFEIADQPPAVPTGGAGVSAATGLGNVPLLEVRRLTFAYPEATRPALERVDVVLDRDRRVAVVGPSGSGKSTLAHLILRFWDVPRGTLYLQGRDVRGLPVDTVREALAFSAQRTHIFTGTLRDNLLLARPEATEAELRRVLELARLEAVVSRLPAGLETWVGEEGHRLSGGERQRLGVARALLRPASILLLDEPTVHLDAITEAEILRGIFEAGRGRGTLLITHRLEGLEGFDEVVVLDQGRVVERGTVAELTAGEGLFARMRTLQRAVRALEDEAFPRDGALSAFSSQDRPGAL